MGGGGVLLPCPGCEAEVVWYCRIIVRREQSGGVIVRKEIIIIIYVRSNKNFELSETIRILEEKLAGLRYSIFAAEYPVMRIR